MRRTHWKSNVLSAVSQSQAWINSISPELCPPLTCERACSGNEIGPYWTLSPPHTRATGWANRLARQLAQLYIFTAHVGKTTQQQHNWQNHLHFPPFCSKSHEETMVCHWLIDSNRRWDFFLARRKISNTIDIFLKASRGQILTKTIRTRELLAELTASRATSRVRRALRHDAQVTDGVVQIWISRQIADCFVSHGILTSGERWQVSFWNLIRKVIGKRRSKDEKLFFLKSLRYRRLFLELILQE
jgi:hypothetical protein